MAEYLGTLTFEFESHNHTSVVSLIFARGGTGTKFSLREIKKHAHHIHHVGTVVGGSTDSASVAKYRKKASQRNS